MPENFLEINRYFALTSYGNTIGQSNHAFSIIITVFFGGKTKSPCFDLFSDKTNNEHFKPKPFFKVIGKSLCIYSVKEPPLYPMKWSSLTQNFKKTNIPLRHQIPCHYSLNDFLTTKGRTSSSNRVNKFFKVVIDHFLFKARHLWHWTVPRLTQLSPLPRPFQYEYTCRELPPTGIAQFKGSPRRTLNPLTKACVTACPHID